MKILLPVDGSYCSLAAAHEVAHRPWPEGSIVRIIYVSESQGEDKEVYPPKKGRPFPPPPEPLGKALGAFEGAAKCIAVEARVLHGRPKVTILDEADRWGADIIVLGAQGTTGIERFLIGSVSLAVAAHAKCTVEIVRPRGRSSDAIDRNQGGDL